MVRLPPVLAAALIGVVGGVARAEIVADAAPSTTGSSGLYRMATVDGVGAPASRLAAFGQFARGSNLLVLDDVDTRVVTRLAAAADVGRHAELFASLSFSYNRDEQPVPDAPSIVQTAFVPDLYLGAKGLAWRNEMFAIGGELAARVPLSGSALPEAISGWLDLLASARLWSAQRSSLRAHLSIGYYFDNEQKQLDMTRLSQSDIVVFMFEHGAGTDRVRGAFGLEGAFHGQSSPSFRPFVEYHHEVARHTPNDHLMTDPVAADHQQWVTVGLKVGLGPRVAIEAGLDVALQSLAHSLGPPLAPYDLWAGVAVPLQASPSVNR